MGSNCDTILFKMNKIYFVEKLMQIKNSIALFLGGGYKFACMGF